MCVFKLEPRPGDEARRDEEDRYQFLTLLKMIFFFIMVDGKKYAENSVFPGR